MLAGRPEKPQEKAGANRRPSQQERQFAPGMRVRGKKPTQNSDSNKGKTSLTGFRSIQDLRRTQRSPWRIHPNSRVASDRTASAITHQGRRQVQPKVPYHKKVNGKEPTPLNRPEDVDCHHLICCFCGI